MKGRAKPLPDDHCKVAPEDYVHFVPTPMKVVHRMLQLAEIQPGETIYDLGCGDGRLVITAVRRYGARGLGIDVDRQRLEWARRRAGPDLDHIVFRRQSVLRTDLRQADVVLMYLVARINFKLIPRLARLKRGTRIVSHNFELPGMAPDKATRLMCRDGYSHRIFVYRTPLMSVRSASIPKLQPL
jgi:trans-aconitate methyltransferase